MGWLSGWAKRVKLTSDSAVIDADLTDFPSLLYISSSSGKNSKDLTFVFDEVGANSKKIAVTKSDGTTQCYVEIERWDSANEKAWLWVKHPTLDADADEDYYLYFDNTQADNTTYVGDPESTPAQNVWDSNFMMRQSMKDYDTSHVHDSTSNDNDGTKVAANEPTEADAKIGKGQSYDGNNDYIEAVDSASLRAYPLTLEIWFESNDTSGKSVIAKAYTTGYWSYGFHQSGTLVFFYEPGSHQTVNSNYTIPTGTWVHAVATYDGSNARVYINGTQANSAAQTGSISYDTNPLRIGGHSATYPQIFNGIIDEVRISNVARSAAWIKASYNSGNDSLWTWGTQEVSKVLTETLGLVDTVVKSPLIVKSEMLGLVDTVTAFRLLTKVLTEFLGLSDTVIKSPSIVKTESLGLVDTYSRIWDAHRTYSELLGLVDTVSKEPGKTFPEALGLVDSIAKAPSIVKSEALGLVDVYSRTWVVYRTYTELLGLLDTVSAQKNPVVLAKLILKLIRLGDIRG